MITPSFNLKYLEDLGCLANYNDRVLVTEWLLSTAVRLEYGDNGKNSTGTKILIG
jgi:hypothetical protein